MTESQSGGGRPPVDEWWNQQWDRPVEVAPGPGFAPDRPYPAGPQFAPGQSAPHVAPGGFTPPGAPFTAGPPGTPGTFGLPPQSPPAKRSALPVIVAVLAVTLLVLAAGAVAVRWFSVRNSGTAAGSISVSSAPVTASSAPAVAATTRPSAPAVAGSVALTGNWTGSYTCNQGPTDLQLDITSDAPADVEAVFTFGPRTDNPAVPSGSFAMKGTLSGTTLTLNGDHWLQQPTGWIMVGLVATVDSPRPQTISGSVVADGCTTFSVTRNPV